MAPTLVRSALTLFLIAVSCTTSIAAVTPLHHAHGHLHSALHKRAPALSNSLPGNWSTRGCYTDNVNSRTLYSSAYTDGSAMTKESCIGFCDKGGYAYAGVEYGQECYCGNSIAASGNTANDGDCNMPCTGNSAEICGSGSRLNLFHNDNIAIPTAGPATNAGPPGWGYLGCYTDQGPGYRTLTGNGASEGGGAVLTVALCTEACEASGWLLAGVEYAGECYCGNSTSNGGGLASDGMADCDMTCNGNSTEYCGGPNRLDVYGYGQKSTIAPQWKTLGCYTDSVQARTLATGMAVAGGAANMTQENCQTACGAKNYALAGVEYSQECYCGNSLQNGGGPASDGNALCDMSCNGDPSEICGGPNRLNMFTYIGGPTSTSSTILATTTSTTATGTATSATATPTGTGTAAALPAAWTYQGCYIDNMNGRILYQQADSSSLTVESCVATCEGLSYLIAGMEYSTQCFCGDYIFDGGALASADSDCAMTCGGNSSEICGGPNRMSIYANGTFNTYAAPTAKNTSLPGSWQYQGCLVDTPQPRVFPYQIEMDTNLTISDCLGLCSEYGYGAGGAEYGNQCFCGDDTDRIAAGAAFQPEANCNTPCSGDPTALCGGANAINYYTWTGLNTWTQATGNAAGEYDFLIGGVVIPLITAQAVTGKVTFVEKHGTGPPNSTGAYELDLTQIDNFDAAWRTMNGLKTDVFCSAGLTLPDKGARQLNIGGWSADSLFGIRLYWPDGSAGVPGTNDWQENVAEVSLQTGRWYPTAMTMANGSILVIGGENGSNGKPVPNLEVVPKPAGGGLVYCDWLDRTDPYNLYPFLAVLPSGGIFVAYYNEARILNEDTFETISTMPNIPGAVNNFLAGRTYPLEGTAMILPQSAPYTDPITVLICGGSTPYQGIALDNCVSIQPEVPNSNWTIERMPSKRVISCMTALPDGTYLILNGATQGAAGFGLANFPNHNAVLYDPTKPLNTRFTLLANTTIDRLYHSEAILLQDGRVLVSGSDPEGLPYVQEYRVEVFIPPYLMGVSNSTQPAYVFNTVLSSTNTTTASNYTSPTNYNATTSPTLLTTNTTAAPANISVAYGQSFTITMTQGSAAKISLMGAVSSTHGNSMGQRTFFPAFSCAGTTCTVTAPPNAHVCPPAWFMMFVLDADGVPSVAQWVWVGGDPAGLGNWPDFPDFDLPGV